MHHPGAADLLRPAQTPKVSQLLQHVHGFERASKCNTKTYFIIIPSENGANYPKLSNNNKYVQTALPVMLRNKVLKGLTGIQNSSLMVMAQISNHLDIFIV